MFSVFQTFRSRERNTASSTALSSILSETTIHAPPVPCRLTGVPAPSDVIESVTGPIRVRVDFGGVRPEDVRLYAVYLDPA